MYPLIEDSLSSSGFVILAAIILLSLGIMICFTFWLIRHRSTVTFHIAVWISYIIITATGGMTVSYAIQKEKLHWSRFFISTCQLFGDLVRHAEHEKVEFSYSLWSEPICSEGCTTPKDQPQPHPEFSTRPLDIPQQLQWENEGALRWLPVPDASEYELAHFVDSESPGFNKDDPDTKEGWVSIYQGSDTHYTPESPGCFRVRSLRVTPLDNPVYERITQILVEAAKTIPDIASVYTMRDYSDEDYVFIVSPAMDVNNDGEIDPESERLAPIGETYPMAYFAPVPPGIREVVITDEAVEDDWGILYSAVITLYRPDGTREGYVGVDYPVEAWQRNVRQTQIIYSIFLVVVFAMYFFGIVQMTRLRLISAEERAVASSLHNTVAELTEAKKAARIAALAKGHFLTNMSHEIRTPMNAVLGFAEILGRRLLDCCPPDQIEDNSQIIEMIDKSGGYLLTVINDILDISKVGADQVELDWVSTEPRKIIEDVHKVISLQLKEKPHVRFHSEIDQSVPKCVYSDPTRLRQILGIICGNAIKFSEKGTIRFNCRLLTFKNTPEKIEEVRRAYGQKVNTSLFTIGSPITLLQFVVQDEGIGISEAFMPRLFQPFTQADVSSTRKYGGTGLGLAIAKHLAESMGGDIAVQSEEGVGSTFYVTFAVEVIHQRADAVSFSGVVLLRDAEKPLSDMNILIVEDGKVNQIVLTTVLQEAGATIQIAENGKLGIEAVDSSEKGFDVILMDMQMPVMDGYEATTRLRESGFNNPIIAVTAHALSGDMEKTFQVGCNDYMSKPVDRDKLIDTILKHNQAAVALQ